jgi:hypothetical protein
MITSPSKNNSFCVEEICNDPLKGCLQGNAQAEQQIHPLRRYLLALWIHIRLFLETDKWESIVSLRVGDSQYIIRMEDIESRWRNG